MVVVFVHRAGGGGMRHGGNPFAERGDGRNPKDGKDQGHHEVLKNFKIYKKL